MFNIKTLAYCSALLVDLILCAPTNSEAARVAAKKRHIDALIKKEKAQQAKELTSHIKDSR